MNNITQQIYDKIIEFDTIILNTHTKPDPDALGSQLGLYLALKRKFSQKKIYAVGDCDDFKEYESHFSTLDNVIYKKALVITTDCGAEQLINDENYKDCAFHIKIDHHVNREPFGDICYVDESSISACQIIYLLLESWDIPINDEIATLLMFGLVTDSGRFLYKNVNSKTFYVASKLMEQNVELNKIYSRIYEEDILKKRYRGHVLSNFIVTENKVAYNKNTQMDIEKSGLSLFDVSRGMVNSMANTIYIEIWANFTETEGGILAELRSKNIPVNTIASMFGGGGHILAAGATLSSWNEVDNMIQSLNNAVKNN